MIKWNIEKEQSKEMYHQYEIFRFIRSLGYDAIPEYDIKIKNNTRYNFKSIRVDILIFKGDQPILAIEVKKPDFKRTSLKPKQGHKYKALEDQLGIPYVLAIGSSKAYLDKIEAKLKTLQPVLVIGNESVSKRGSTSKRYPDITPEQRQAVVDYARENNCRIHVIGSNKKIEDPNSGHTMEFRTFYHKNKSVFSKYLKTSKAEINIKVKAKAKKKKLTSTEINKLVQKYAKDNNIKTSKSSNRITYYDEKSKTYVRYKSFYERYKQVIEK